MSVAFDLYKGKDFYMGIFVYFHRKLIVYSILDYYWI